MWITSSHDFLNTIYLMVSKVMWLPSYVLIFFSLFGMMLTKHNECWPHHKTSLSLSLYIYIYVYIDIYTYVCVYIYIYMCQRILKMRWTYQVGKVWDIYDGMVLVFNGWVNIYVWFLLQINSLVGWILIYKLFCCVSFDFLAVYLFLPLSKHGPPPRSTALSACQPSKKSCNLKLAGPIPIPQSSSQPGHGTCYLVPQISQSWC